MKRLKHVRDFEDKRIHFFMGEGDLIFKFALVEVIKNSDEVFQLIK